MESWKEKAFEAVFPPGAVPLAEWNDCGNWDGCGAAIAKLESYYAAEYSHCSCYGPADAMKDLGSFATYEEARRSISAYMSENGQIPETEPPGVS